MVKVAFDVTAIPAKPAGAGRYVVDVVQALAERDDVDLVCVARGDDAARWPGEVLAVAPANRAARLLWEQLRAPSVGRDADVSPAGAATLPVASRHPRARSRDTGLSGWPPPPARPAGTPP